MRAVTGEWDYVVARQQGGQTVEIVRADKLSADSRDIALLKIGQLLDRTYDPEELQVTLLPY